MIRLQDVSKTFPPSVSALHPLSLTISTGERFGLLGPSGSGKSTLLRLIAGLDELTTGTIHLDSTRIDRLPPHHRGIAFLPQKAALYPHLTVQENVSLTANSNPKRISEAVQLLRLESLLARRPHQLSGGERQRVALAKLLTRQTGVILLDEPLNALDPLFRSEFRQVLHLLLDQCGATIIFVTHDPEDAGALGHRIGVMDEGRLLQLGTPDELRSSPHSRFVAHCFGSWNLLDGHISDRVGGGDPSRRYFVSKDGCVSVPLPGWWKTDTPDNLTLGIRPADVLSYQPDDSSSHEMTSFGGLVVATEPVGSGWLLTVRCGSTAIRVGRHSGSPLPVGASAVLHLPADSCIWFDGRSGRRIRHPD